MDTNINLPLTISIHHQKNYYYYYYYYYYRKYNYGDQSGEFERGYWGLKDSPWDLFRFQSDYHTDDISSEIYKWVLYSNYQLSSSQHCSVHLGYEMQQLIENSDGVASQVRTQGSVKAPRAGGGGGGGGMGTKNCPLGIMYALPTHIILNFEVVFLLQKLSATHYISEMLSCNVHSPIPIWFPHPPHQILYGISNLKESGRHFNKNIVKPFWIS